MILVDGKDHSTNEIVKFITNYVRKNLNLKFLNNEIFILSTILHEISHFNSPASITHNQICLMLDNSLTTRTIGRACRRLIHLEILLDKNETKKMGFEIKKNKACSFQLSKKYQMLYLKSNTAPTR